MKSLLTIIIVSSAFVSLQSQTFVKHDAVGNNDGTTWQDAFTNLQVALEQSFAGDQIWVAAGTYVPEGPSPDSSHFVISEAIELYGGFAGTESSLEERDFETHLTILSGDINGDDTPGDTSNRTDNAHHLVMIETSFGVANIDGFILQSGTTRFDDYVVGEYNPWHHGGAMFVQSEVVLRNCTFRDNDGYRAAAFYVQMTDSSSTEILAEDCLFVSNRSFEHNIRIINLANPVFKKCTFRDNQAIGYGSGIVLGNSNLTVEHCFFENNSTESWGGAIAIWQNSSTAIDSPHIRIKGSVFAGNSAIAYGGAIGLQNFITGTELVIDSCEFSNNTVSEDTGEGGAIRVFSIKSVPTDISPTTLFKVTESTFLDNKARLGGAVMTWEEGDSMKIDISNSRFTNNEASFLGGGLYVRRKNNGITYARFSDVSFDGNTGVVGGGLFFNNFDFLNRGNYEINNCSFKNNVAEDFGGAIFSNGSNGMIAGSEFLNNTGLNYSGALHIGRDSLTIENCLFSGNFTNGTSSDPNRVGAGANLFYSVGAITIKNTIYENNISGTEGSAILLVEDAKVRIENSLLYNHGGNSTIFTRGNLALINVTMADNELAIFQAGEAFAEFQNTILQSEGLNYLGFSNTSVDSKGGNISNDDSMTDLLNGFGDFEDRHETDPGLDMAYVPLEGSPCIDKGNPNDIVADFDLAGNDRIQGSQIDIGSFESSFTTAVKDAKWNTLEVNVFPNPVVNMLQFQIADDFSGMLTVSIYDLLGRKVLETRQNKESGVQLFQENVSQLSNGEYVLFISNTDITYASSIIVQH